MAIATRIACSSRSERFRGAAGSPSSSMRPRDLSDGGMQSPSLCEVSPGRPQPACHGLRCGCAATRFMDAADDPMQIKELAGTGEPEALAVPTPSPPNDAQPRASCTAGRATRVAGLGLLLADERVHC